ncbi:MAG: GAF domain-containing sensor histidine kinase, partial [bacterium]|nr:GAF domain-containing sensor histidine kinase [bacterium]
QVQAAQNPLFQLKRAAVDRLVELKVAVVIPIVVNKKLIGIVFLGDKLSNDSFYEQDLNFLTIVGGQTANAIEKARFFEEDQLKSEFVSIASHELLTPTAAIEGYLSMILEEKMGVVDQKAETYLWTVFQSSKRLSALVKNLLSVSRIESGRIKVEPKIFDLNEVVAQQLDQLQVKATEAKLYLKAKYPRHQASVFADPERVTQAVVNMISNGLKYTKEGGVTVAVVEKPRFYEVQVTDTGVGIAEADRQHLFQKFSRIETSATAGIMGTGLGLYITKAVVELMGGSVWVKSTVGKGSTFAFSVPKQKVVKTAN